MNRPTTPTFSPAESSALRALRAAYQQHRDFFSAREMARLRFQHWLCHTGRAGPWMGQGCAPGVLWGRRVRTRDPRAALCPLLTTCLPKVYPRSRPATLAATVPR